MQCGFYKDLEKAPADCAFFHRPIGGLNAWIHVSGSIFASRFRGKRKDRMEES